VERNSLTPEIDLGQVIALAFFDGKRDVLHLAGLVFLDEGNVEAAVGPADVAQFQRLVENLRGEVAFLLVGVADALFILFELRSVEGLGEEILEDKSNAECRSDADFSWPRITSRWLNALLPRMVILPTLIFGAFDRR
jgi:hypothetical protein